ncbi:MAG: SRPBCC family protein [Thermoleophilaceae bacterium]
MTSSAREHVRVPVGPERAMSVWTDVRRWPAFVEGFGRLVEQDPAWPEVGAGIVWESIPRGRGRVSERVVEAAHGRLLATEVLEERLTGMQTVRFEPAEGDDVADVGIELDYRLVRGGPLGRVADVLFIRRAMTEALQRTLERFAMEVEEEDGP